MRIMVVALLCACALGAHAEVTQISPGTYIIMRQSNAGVFVNMPKLKAKVIAEANAFAEQQGKVAIPVSAKETPPAPFQMPKFEYQFRLVDKDSPEAKGVTLADRPDLVVESNQNIKVDTRASSTQQPPPQDLYAELLKLDDLHKRGILTDAEFEAQKAKLLAGSR